MQKSLAANPAAVLAAVPAGDSTGAPGNAVINARSGKFAIAAAAAAATITNSTVTAASIVIGQVITNDGTLKSVSCVPGAGSFTATGNAAATGITAVGFLVVN